MNANFIHVKRCWSGVWWINLGSGMFAVGFRYGLPVRGMLFRHFKWDFRIV